MMMMGMIRMYAHLLREISECHEKMRKGEGGDGKQMEIGKVFFCS